MYIYIFLCVCDVSYFYVRYMGSVFFSCDGFGNPVLYNLSS